LTKALGTSLGPSGATWPTWTETIEPERDRVVFCSVADTATSLYSRSLLIVTTEEVTNHRGDLMNVSFEGEVARIVKMHFGAWVVAPECLGAGGEKERIVLAPHR
jgi:hypothetical protein